MISRSIQVNPHFPYGMLMIGHTLLSTFLIFSLAVSVVGAQDLYFPTVKDSKRVMRTTLGKNVSTFTETIVRAESVGEEHVVTVSRENPAFEHGYGKRFNVYQFAISANGLFFVRKSDDNSEDREPLLKLPAKEGETWKSKNRDVEQNLDETATFTIGKPELVSVPAGKFRAVPVTTEYAWQRDGKIIATSKQTTWYAARVGVVKHINYRDDADDMVTELSEFVLGDTD